MYEPKFCAQYSAPLLAAAAPIPIARYEAFSMFQRWPCEFNQASITAWADW